MTKQNGDDQTSNVCHKIDKVILDARRIFISDGIDNEIAEEVVRKLWYLELTNPGKPILLVINSPGGSVDSGFAIWDTVQMITSPVSTLVTGLAASMGTVLGVCAEKGRRYASPYARFMIHQPSLSGVIQGQATDLEIQAREINKTRKVLVDLYSRCTGRDEETVDKALDRDSWMSAQEAKEFGLVDKIVNSFEDIAS